MLLPFFNEFLPVLVDRRLDDLRQLDRFLRLKGGADWDPDPHPPTDPVSVDLELWFEPARAPHRVVLVKLDRWISGPSRQRWERFRILPPILVRDFLRYNHIPLNLDSINDRSW